MKFLKKTLTLGHLVQNRDIYLGMYKNVTTFKDVLEIDRRVVEPLDRIFKAHDKKLSEIREKHKDEPSAANMAYADIMNEELQVEVACITEKQAEDLGYNVFQYRIIKDFIRSK